jgi:hypothetical protein
VIPAPEKRKATIWKSAAAKYSFGQRVQMSVDQFRKLAAEGVSDRLQTLTSL